MDPSGPVRSSIDKIIAISWRSSEERLIRAINSNFTAITSASTDNTSGAKNR